MDNEKYGIELELIINKFKQKMQEVKNTFKGLSDKKVNIKANTNTAQIEYLKNQIKEISALLDYNAKKPFMDYNEVLKNRAELEKLTNQYNKLINQQNKVNSTSKKTHSNITKGLEKMTSKIKRFGLALFSIRSIYSLVSRASSAYLSQDTELANKLQSAWIGLGAVLAPIINFIATLILKVISVINTFIKAMTGVDLIAKASAKSMKAAAGSARSLNKALAGFDELQNLDTDAGGGTGGFGGFGDAFENIDQDWETQKEKLFKGIDSLKEGMIKKITETRDKLVKLLSLAGMNNLIISGVSMIFDGIEDLWSGLFDTMSGILKVFIGILTGDKQLVLDGFKQLGKGIWEIISGLAQMIAGTMKTIVGLIWEGIKSIWNSSVEYNAKIMLAIQELLSKIWNKITETFTKIINWIGQTFIQPVINYFNSLWNKLLVGALGLTEGIKSTFQSILVWIYNHTIQPILNLFNNLWSGITRGFRTAWNRIANTVNSVGGKIGIHLPTFNSYAVGTNYVPEDQLAFIHKGEAVVPKKYNNAGYTPNNNDETNALLEQVITAINNIEINPYTTVKDVGKASLSYINAKSRQLGESVVV